MMMERTTSIRVRADAYSSNLLGTLNQISTLPRHLLLRPHEGSSISHPLGLDGYIGFFARRLYGFDGLCDASAVLLMFLVIFHAVSYSALRMDAMRSPTSCHTISRSSGQ
jgi:hypothetical protein